MAYELRQTLESLVVVGRDHRLDLDRHDTVRGIDAVDVVARLKCCLIDSTDMGVIRQVVAEHHVGDPRWGLSDLDALHAFARLVVAGRVALRRAEAPKAVVSMVRPGREEPEATEPRPAEPGVSEEPIYDVYLRLMVPPDEAAEIGDQFTLFGGASANARDYEQTLTTSDDPQDGGDYVELLFEDLKPDLKYWLEIDPGDEGDTYFAFEAWPWSKIQGIAMKR